MDKINKAIKIIDVIIRCIFVFVIFEFFFLQFMIRFNQITTVVDFAIETLAMFIYNCVVYFFFLLYNILILIFLFAFRIKLSVKFSISSFSIATWLIILSLLFL